MDAQVDNVEPQESISPEVEQEARQLGWVPLEEFRGGEDRWIDADKFVERGREILPILKKNKQELLEKNKLLESEVREMKETFNEFKEYRKKDQERAYKQALTDLKEQKKTAIAEGDGERVLLIEDQIEEIKEEQKTPQIKETKPSEAPVDPLFTEWVNVNTWFAQDAALQHAANAAGVDIANEAFINNKEQPTGRAFLDEVAKRVKERYPEKFGTPRRSTSQVEEGTNTRTTTSKKQTYNSLPAEAKAACDKFVKQGLMTQEDYVRDYDWN